jgi:chromosome segregation ATPase
MTRAALIVRRSTTVIAIVLAIGIGFFAIRAAAAWTASAAPLEITPATVTSLQEQLDIERTRSAALASELERLTSESSELEAALGAAQAQIAADTGHASELSKDLDAARTKLLSLEKAIKAARTALARQPAVTVTTVRTATTTQERDHDDEDDEEEHDDD